MDSRTVEIIIKAKDEASRVLDRVNGAAKDTESGGVSKLKAGTVALGTAMGNMAVMAGQVAVQQLGASMTAFKESRAQTAELEQVLKSTGRTSEFTLEQLTNMAAGLEKVSLFEDEAIMNTQSLMLGFANIGKDIIPQATQSAMDMAQAMGTDLQSATIQLSKALNDPIEGVSALSRVGVTFTEQEKAMMEQMVKTGDAAGAQQMILKTLAGPNGFGGAAKAASDAAGPTEKVKDIFNNAKESVGGFLTEALEKTITFIMDTAIPAFQSWWDKIQPVVMAIYEFLKPSLEALWNTLQEKLMPALQKLWEQLEPVLMPVLKFLAILIGGILLGAIWLFINAINVVYTVISFVIDIIAKWIQMTKENVTTVIDAVKAIIDWFKKLPENVRNIVDGIVNWFRNLPGRIMDAIGSLWEKFTGFFGRLGEGMKNGISGAIEGVKNIVKGGINWVIDKVNTAIRAVNNTAGKLPGVPNIPEIPKLYKGSNFFGGGLALVGERGPELVNLPRGSQVTPADDTASALNKPTIINITNNNYSQLDLDQVVKDLSWRLATQ